MLVAIRHGQPVDGSAALRRHNGEYHLPSRAELEMRPPGHLSADRVAQHAWHAGLDTAVELAKRCHSSLREERRHFPAVPIPDGRTPDQQLAALCQAGVRDRYAMDDPAVSAEVGGSTQP